ncbi:hypothetical protein FGIG_11495, partial [Fasciola gigantica]
IVSHLSDSVPSVSTAVSAPPIRVQSAFSVSRAANASIPTAVSTSVSLPARKTAEVVEMAGEVIELVIAPCAPGKQARAADGEPMVISDEGPPSVVRILRLPTEALPVDSSNRRRKTKPEGRSPEPCFVCQISTTGQRLGIPTCLECDRTFFRMFVDIFNLKRSCSCPTSATETAPPCTPCRLRTCMEKALRQWGSRLSHRALQSWLSVDQSMDILFKNAKNIDDIWPLLGKCGLSSSSISNLDFPGDVTSVSDDTVPIEATKRRLLDNNAGIPTALYTPSPSGRRPLVSSTSKSGKIKMDWSNSPNIARPLLPKPSLNSDIRVIELPAVPSSPHTAVTVRLSNSNKMESTELTTDASAQPTYIQLQQGNTTITRAILPKPTTEQCSSPLLSTEVDEHVETAPLTEEEVLGRRLSRIIKPGFMQVFSKHFKSLPSEPQLLDTALDNRSTLFQLFDFFDWEWNLPIQVPPSVRQAVWTVFHEQFNESLTDMVRFIKRVPGFPILKPQDRILLVRNSGFELAFLVHYLNWNTEFVCWHGPDNFVLTLEQLCTIFPAGMKFFHYAFTNTKRLTKLTQQLQHLGLFAALIILDDGEFCCLRASYLFRFSCAAVTTERAFKYTTHQMTVLCLVYSLHEHKAVIDLFIFTTGTNIHMKYEGIP